MTDTDAEVAFYLCVAIFDSEVHPPSEACQSRVYPDTLWMRCADLSTRGCSRPREHPIGRGPLSRLLRRLAVVA